MNKFRQNQTTLIKIGLALLTIIIVGLIIFAAIYFTKNKENNKYIDKLYNIKQQVDKSNNNIADAVSNLSTISPKDSSDLKNIKNIFADEIANLKSILDTTDTINPPSKYKTQYNNYVNGIQYNKDVLNQAYLILLNTKSNKIPEAVNELASFINKTVSSYEAGKLKKAYITLPSGILKLNESINNFATNSIKYYKDIEHNQDLYAEYFNQMDKVIKDFSISKSDLSINVDQIDSGSLSTNDAYVKIENKLTAITGIQTAYNILSPPPKMGDRHKAFNDIINSYIFYCQDFKIALSSYEEAMSDPAALSTAKQTFSDLKSKYTTLSKNFTDYWNNYNSDKNKYNDVNNLE